MTYLKLTKINAKHVSKEKIFNESANLFDLKIINSTTNAKNVEKIWMKQVNGLIKKFLSIYKFCDGDLNNLFFFC